MKKGKVIKAFKTAFPYTLPIMAGFAFLGMSYGIYMNSLGFSPIYPIVMSAVIFAGSMEFVTANLLLGAFDPVRALILAIMVNARHLFYGLSMLDRFKNTGRKKPYLIFGMCDESFSINCSVDLPSDVDKGWYMVFVTVLNQLYWVLGATIGAVLGSFISFDTNDTKGLDFVMTALFVVIFIEQWFKERSHHSGLIGIGITLLSLIAFGGESFIIPAMLFIIALLLILRNPLEIAQGSEDK